MNSKFFKKIKFFKSDSAPKARAQNNSVPPEKNKAVSFWKNLFSNPLIFLFLFVAILSYFIAYLPSQSLPQNLTEGEIATSDIIAPMDLTIEDIETTEKRRNEAVEAVLPVYSQDPNVTLNIEEKIRQFFSIGRALMAENPTTEEKNTFRAEIEKIFGLELSSTDLNNLIKADYGETLEETLINLIIKVSEPGIIVSKNLFIHGEEEKGLAFIKSSGSEQSIQTDDLLDITESKERLTQEIDQLEFPQSEKALLKKLAHFFIQANVIYDRLVTEQRKREARESVSTVFYTIKKGKVILRKGDEINADALKQIEIINQNLQAKPSWLTNFSGIFLLFTLLILAVWYYMKSLVKTNLALKYFLMMGVTLILSILFYKLFLFLADTFSQSSSISFFSHTESYYYAFPFQFGTLLFAFLTTIPIALVLTVVNSLLVGYLFQSNFSLLIFCLVGGFAAIYGIKYYGKQNRISTFKTGFFLIAPINFFIIITFHLIRERLGPFDIVASELLMGLIGGMLSAALAFVFMPGFENLFDIATQSKLLELTNSDLPIFREMAMEAPGSYHHSLIVASLAENAAEEIDLDPMVAKTGALYHDIGKIKRPEYFIENRGRTPDRHKDLKPSMSTLVIINHVKEGVDRAKKLKLPKVIRDIIEQHHGSSLVRYFYEKAKTEYDPEMQKIGEENYRYAGPKPKIKEAALIMLADSVEAASRSLKSPTKTNLKRVITEIINSYIQDGQLDDCDFSLRELRTIASSFLDTMYTIYHHRTEYPGFDFEMKKKPPKKSNAANDRNFKQPETA
ncbi:MAG: HDIG domain-containing protein [Candidatus Aminicenantes bacterium]|jgi:putative nucleotidyltransferase with HDIG domain